MYVPLGLTLDPGQAVPFASSLGSPVYSYSYSKTRDCLQSCMSNWHIAQSGPIARYNKTLLFMINKETIVNV